MSQKDSMKKHVLKNGIISINMDDYGPIKHYMKKKGFCKSNSESFLGQNTKRYDYTCSRYS